MTFLYICKIDNMKYYRGILSGFKKIVRAFKSYRNFTLYR